MNELIISGTPFTAGGEIPVKYSTFGDDVSPALHLEGISENAVSLAVMFTDRSHPIPDYCHWIMWNIPIVSDIPEGIPYGEVVPSLSGAIQGVGYGKHRYKGPRPPFRKPHTYALEVYSLDRMLDLPTNSRRGDFLIEAGEHILQKAEITAGFCRP